jgi:hypothetical protein
MIVDAIDWLARINFVEGIFVWVLGKNLGAALGKWWWVSPCLIVIGLSLLAIGHWKLPPTIVAGPSMAAFSGKLEVKKIPGAPEIRQEWDKLAERFKQITSRPIPVYAEWIYTNETKRYDWWIRHSSEMDVKMCIELCKEAGRLLLAAPEFKQKFPEISAVVDDGDRWLIAIYKVAGIGKVETHSVNSSFGVTTATADGGRIADVPRASQVLCQMARVGF